MDKLINNMGEKFNYLYDFGDGWDHKIELEDILPFDRNEKYPLCIAGKRNCPPEDCGGMGGYENLLEIILDPDHDEYEDMMDWLWDNFDPEHFDKDEINELLQEEDYGCITLDD